MDMQPKESEPYLQKKSHKKVLKIDFLKNISNDSSLKDFATPKLAIAPANLTFGEWMN